MTRYGVLISNKENSDQLAVLELEPTGMLITATFEGGLHPYALKPFVDRLVDQPIYEKYAEVLARDKVLSPELLEAEIGFLAELINEGSMTLGGFPIKARTAHRD